jgi:outer membrane protein assembly factor BamA
MANPACHTPTVRFLLPVLAVLAFARVAHADQIGEIVVEKNTKTDSATVQYLAKIDVGDDWTEGMVEEIKRNLVSSGLFKDIEVFWEPGPKGVRVHILAEDKHSWIIAPAYYNQPTNQGGGVGFGENNLFGQNQKLLLYGQVATGETFFIGALVIPAINGTRWSAQFDTYLKTSRIYEYAAPTKFLESPEQIRQSRMHYLNGGIKLGLGLTRFWRFEARLRGAKVSYVNSKTEYVGDPGDREAQLGIPDDQAVPKPGKEGWDISSQFTFSIDRRANWYGVQSGHKIALTYEASRPEMGSDFHYQLVTGSLFQAWQVLERHNLVIKLNANYGHHLPFQQEFTTGGTSMRGYLNDQFRGDLKLAGNLEYSVPLVGALGLSMRGLVFWDSAYTTFLTTSNPERNYLPNAAARGLDPFRNSVGGGVRFYLRQIVLPLLGVDVGYGLEARDVQVYLAIGLTD